MQTAPPLTLKANAKLNLALAVGPPEPPTRYHPICSWFVPIDLHDTLTFERLPTTTPSRFNIRWASDAPKPTPIDWPIEKDLAVRAHVLLERHVEKILPVALTMEKRTPVGGGLGGGSSDAAAMLLGLNSLFDLTCSKRELAALSTHLGSDIAFFIDDNAPPRPAIVSGRGERIERVSSLPRTDVLLLVPPFGCPTGAVYQAFDRAPKRAVDEPRIRTLVAASVGGALDSHHLFNDLAEPACLVQTPLRDILNRAQAAIGAAIPIHVTGSGSTMFCFPTNPMAAATAIRNACPDVITLATHIPATAG